MIDVVIIGGGVVGGCILRELRKYNVNVLLIEKENDVCEGASKANSAIVHSGYDPEPGSLMAKLNVKGNAKFEEICKDLKVPFKRNGSLIIGFNNSDKVIIENLYNRGIKNGVLDIKILSKEEIYEKEPNLSEGIELALYTPTGGIVDAYEFTIALIENGVSNGGKLLRNNSVINIKQIKNGFALETDKKQIIEAKIIINAAGINADKIHNMICKKSYEIRPVKGQYFVLDKQSVVSSTIFQCPTKDGKGVVVTPTVHGNILVGPDAIKEESKTNVGTSQSSLNNIKEISQKTTKIDFATNIRNFAGIRSHSDKDDFIIEESFDVPGFFDVAGIKSPGLSSSPAIAEMVVNMVGEKIDLTENKEFDGKRYKTIMSNLSIEEKNKLIKKNNLYGRVICRCEGITEGEIIESIKNGCGAVSIEGVKKRCRPGAGRCQGGFCGPKILEIISRELEVAKQNVMFSKTGSNIIVGDNKYEL